MSLESRKELVKKLPGTGITERNAILSVNALTEMPQATVTCQQERMKLRATNSDQITNVFFFSKTNT